MPTITTTYILLGDALMFEGKDYVHGVAPILKGERNSLIIFLGMPDILSPGYAEKYNVPKHVIQQAREAREAGLTLQIFDK